VEEAPKKEQDDVRDWVVCAYVFFHEKSRRAKFLPFECATPKNSAFGNVKLRRNVFFPIIGASYTVRYNLQE
jgi:hypothetical protein